MGSLSSIKAEDVRFLVLPVAVGLLPLFLLRWRMNLLTVGEEEAQSMGVRTGVLRLVVILLSLIHIYAGYGAGLLLPDLRAV